MRKFDLSLRSFFFSYSADHRHLHSFPTRRSSDLLRPRAPSEARRPDRPHPHLVGRDRRGGLDVQARSEEHTSELQSRLHLVCRLLLEKKKFLMSRKIILIKQELLLLAYELNRS